MVVKTCGRSGYFSDVAGDAPMVNKGRESTLDNRISDESQLVSTGERKQQREGSGYIRSLRVSIMSEKIPTPPLFFLR